MDLDMFSFSCSRRLKLRPIKKGPSLIYLGNTGGGEGKIVFIGRLAWT